MSNRFKFAVIGCGPRGRDHTKAAIRSEQFDAVAAADIDAKRLNELCDAHGVKGRYTDYKEMLRKEKPDAVHVCLQPTLRVQPVKEAIAAGARAIVVEKPMAFDFTEASNLVKMCDDAGVLLVVNHQKRNMIEWVKLKDAVASGKLGKVEMLRCSCYGNVLSQGTHMLDQAWNMLGEPAPKWLVAGAEETVSEAPHHPGPQNVMALVAYENGVRASYTIGNDSPPIPNSKAVWFWCNIEIRGTEGKAEAILDQGYKRWDKDGNLAETQVSRWDDEFQGAGQAKLSADIASALRDPNFKHPQRGASALHSFSMVEA
ncbi:MAG: Gfo/Idh/MocA family oxidoreductase, partial [Planctomycetota bacterium]|nr:Gfo/Idh/MocA family oxidoreductase [Planctomycetota bacterium]